MWRVGERLVLLYGGTSCVVGRSYHLTTQISTISTWYLGALHESIWSLRDMKSSHGLWLFISSQQSIMTTVFDLVMNRAVNVILSILPIPTSLLLLIKILENKEQLFLLAAATPSFIYHSFPLIFPIKIFSASLYMVNKALVKAIWPNAEVLLNVIGCTSDHWHQVSVEVI